MDNVSKKKRSEIMRAVKSKDSAIEIKFGKALWAAGFRYRKNDKRLTGKPDIVLKKHKTVIFIDSCFWHGCKKHCRIPSTKRSYWTKKIKRNKERDKEVNDILRKEGWKVLRFWEHDIKSNFEACVKKIIKELQQ